MAETSELVGLLRAQGSGDRHEEARLITKLLDRTGTTRANARTKRPPHWEFWGSLVFGTGGCWLWCRARHQLGYGLSSKGKAHRYAWELFNGPIPEGLSVLHRCDIRNCVNPDHLFLGTQADNMRDAATKGRIVAVPQPGEANPMAKLTQSQVEKMRYIRATTNKSYKALAAQFGVTAMTAYRAVKGESWK